MNCIILSLLLLLFFLPSILRSRGSLKINYEIQRWVRSSVRAVSGRQTVVISYVPFTAVIWRIKVYILCQYTWD